ncbi:MAG: hypothetical protein JOZ87_29010 [Chloroflexi bacterium]|nr:hypothetical protein [Chloroflexota bacterium]
MSLERDVEFAAGPAKALRLNSERTGYLLNEQRDPPLLDPRPLSGKSAANVFLNVVDLSAGCLCQSLHLRLWMPQGDFRRQQEVGQDFVRLWTIMSEGRWEMT